MIISSKMLMIPIQNSKNIRGSLDCNNFWIYHKILKITLFNKDLLYSLPNIVKIKINFKRSSIPSIHIIESKCIFHIKLFKLILIFWWIWEFLWNIIEILIFLKSLELIQRLNILKNLHLMAFGLISKILPKFITNLSKFLKLMTKILLKNFS